MAKMDGDWLLTAVHCYLQQCVHRPVNLWTTTVVEDNEVVLEYLDGIAVQVMQPEISITLDTWMC